MTPEYRMCFQCIIRTVPEWKDFLQSWILSEDPKKYPDSNIFHVFF